MDNSQSKQIYLIEIIEKKHEKHYLYEIEQSIWQVTWTNKNIVYVRKKVQITSLKYDQSPDNPLNYLLFNFTPVVCHLVQFIP